MLANPLILEHDTNFGATLHQVDLNKKIFSEAWLQELIRARPEILPVSEIEPIFSPLIPIGREVAVAVGSIDNLFISYQGYLVLVETKLWKNPEAKREVLAQAIDYGNAVSGWNFSKLDEVTRAYTQRYEGKSSGLVDWVVQQKGPLDVDRVYFEDTISRNLRLGRFLILVVGDRIRSEVVDLLGYVNRFPHLAMNVALIELRCYHIEEENDWPLLIIPSLIARTEIVQRSIVEVTVNVDGTSKVQVIQKKESEKSSRAPLTEQDYWDRLRLQSLTDYEMAYKLFEYFRNKDQISIQPREESIAVYLILPDSGQQISLFFIRTNGVVQCWPGTIAGQLKNANLDINLAHTYRENLSSILLNRTKKLALYFPAHSINIDDFVSVVERFIASILTSDQVG